MSLRFEATSYTHSATVPAPLPGLRGAPGQCGGRPPPVCGHRPVDRVVPIRELGGRVDVEAAAEVTTWHRARGEPEERRDPLPRVVGQRTHGLRVALPVGLIDS